MTRFYRICAGAVAAFALGVAPSCGGDDPAPAGPSPGITVLTGAVVATADPARPRAEAVAFDAAGSIIAVGAAADVLGAAGPDAKVVDLAGRTLLPGFQDVHLHPVEAGINAENCLFPAFGGAADYRALVRDCARGWPGDGWVVGAGVNMAELTAAVADPLQLLDAAEPRRPVLILDDLGHGAWANSAALAAVGYDTLSGDPPGGLLLRDADGGLTGVVLENAQHKLRDAAFPPTPENLQNAYHSLLDALETLARNGITSVSDAGGYWPQGHDAAWRRAESEGRLTVRASNALYLYPDRPFEAQLAELRSRFSRDRDRLLRFDQVKIYVDGILSQTTGALFEPYAADLGLFDGHRRGFLYFAETQLTARAQALAAAGFQLHFHATGDRGASLALDAIEAAAPESGPHRITHLFLVDPGDIPRFASAGAVADLQLAPSALAADYRSYMAELIGPAAGRLMPLGSLLAAGAAVTLSSDWDADELSPLVKIAAAMERPSEGIPSLEAAIEMVTLQPARLLRHADRTGSIAVGKFADLVVIDRDLFALPPARIADARMLATLLQGEPVFDPGGLFR